MLRHSRCRMPQHLSYIRKRNIVGQRNNGSERVPGGVRGEVFLYTTYIGYFLQITVHLLVAKHREHNPLVNAIRVVFVFFQNLSRNTQKWDIAKIVCLFARLYNLQIPITVFRYMFWSQIIYIDES